MALRPNKPRQSPRLATGWSCPCRSPCTCQSTKRNLGDRLGSTWLAAWSQVQLGTLSVLRGDLRQARTLLNEALELSLAARSTSGVTLCLAAHARLALAEGDPGRAALLAGAVEELRRPGLRVWPTLRRGEAEMVAEIQHALGMEQLDQAFLAGAELTQRDVVAIVGSNVAGAILSRRERWPHDVDDGDLIGRRLRRFHGHT